MNAPLSIAPSRKWDCAFIALLLLYFGVALCLSLARFYSYKASLLDLGVFDQVFWQLQRGEAPMSIPQGIAARGIISLDSPAIHWMGFHFSPILYPLAAFYYLFPYPETLLVLHCGFLVLSAVPIYCFVRQEQQQGGIALLWSSLLLINPFLINASLWEFHEVDIAVCFMSLTLFALLKKRFLLFCLALFGLMACKEHYGIAAAAAGFMWGMWHKEWRRACIVILTGLVIFYLVVFQIMPLFNHHALHPMLENFDGQASRYSWLRNTPMGIWHSFKILLFSNGDLSYPESAIFYPLQLLFASPLTLILSPVLLLPAIADFAANFFSANSMPRHFEAYHSAVLVPVIIFASYVGAKRFVHYFPDLSFRRISIYILSYSLLLAFLGAPFLRGDSVWQLDRLQLQQEETIAVIRASLSPEDMVSAQNNVGSFFSQRHKIYPFPMMMEKSDVIILHLACPYKTCSYDPFGTVFGNSASSFLHQVSALMSNPNYGVVLWENNWLVLRRGTKDRIPARPSIAKKLQILHMTMKAEETVKTQ